MEVGKKTCKKCGKTLPINNFGYLSKSVDGRNCYCRSCMQKFTKKYKKSTRGKKKQEKALKRYKKKNKKQIKEYNKQYYLKHRTFILDQIIAKKTTECVNIFDDEIRTKKNINSKKDIDDIVINPQPRKKNE
jgi:hypothetical protein